MSAKKATIVLDEPEQLPDGTWEVKARLVADDGEVLAIESEPCAPPLLAPEGKA